MWWSLLPLSFVINNFYHKSRVTVSYNKIIDPSPHSVYQSFHIWRVTVHIIISIIPNIFSKIMCHSLLQRKIDYSRLISTISTFIQDGYPRSSAAQRSSALWRVTASGLRRRSCSWPLQRLYHHICQCVNVYTNQTSISLDYPGQDRLPNWLSGVSQPRVIRGMSAITPLVLLAAMLTLLLAHIPPLSRCNIVYILSQDCFGQSS